MSNYCITTTIMHSVQIIKLLFCFCYKCIYFKFCNKSLQNRIYLIFGGKLNSTKMVYLSKSC